jgi:4-oxalocrotonate tautomerase
MPLVRIDLAKGTSAQFRKTLGDIVYKAMIDIIDVPKDDKFQIITEHSPEELNYAPSYLGIEHSSGLVLIQVTMSVGRTVQAKQAFYREIAEQLHAQLGIRKEDVFINL